MRLLRKIEKNIFNRNLLVELPFIFLLIFFVYLSSKALFHSGFFRTIDDITTVRIIYLEKELRRGEWINNFPVRWSGELSYYNYGYPLYLFYAPLVYYIGAFLMIFLKLSHIVATKWVYVFPLLVGPFLFYLAGRQKLGRFSSLIGSVFYTLFPFRGYDTYIRGGVGEAWAMSFLPGIILGMFLLEKGKKEGKILVWIFTFLIIISHNISAIQILFLILLMGFVFFLKNKNFWISFLLGILMASFFWIPAFYYLPLVRVSYSSQNMGEIFNFLVPIYELIKIKFKFLPEDRFSSLFFYMFILSGFFWIIFKENKIKIKKKEFLFWFLSGVFLYFLLSNQSKWFWKLTFSIGRFLQFPWRLLVLLSFILPYLAGITIEKIKKNYWRIFFGCLFIIISLNFLPAFRPKEYSFFFEYKAEDSGPCATSWGDEYIPIWVKRCPGSFPQKDIEVIGLSNLEISKNNIINLEGILKGNEETQLIIHRYYFPGWKVLVDGKEVQVDYNFSEWGIFKFIVSPGTHKLNILFTKTKIMWLADFISLFSFLIFIFLIIKEFIFRINLRKIIKI